jgi:acyl-CoA thioesterase
LIEDRRMHEEHIKKLFNTCNVANLLGIEIIELEEGRAKGRLVLRKEHMNLFGSVHGGILFTLADHVGGACGNTLGKKAVLVESSMHYLRGVSEGMAIFAEATLTHWGRTIGRTDVRVFDEDNNVIALGHQICYIKDDEHTPT